MSILSDVIYYNLENVLNDFDSIPLEDLEPDNLMDRKDRKFLIPENKLHEVLQKLKRDYLVLNVHGKRISRYQTLYLDLQNFQFYINHHNGSGHRYKLRFRHYADTNHTFFEVKYKNNKKRTLKNRFLCNDISFPLKHNICNFITEYTNINPEVLEPKLWVNYKRITLVNKFRDERITIDLSINLKADNAISQFNKLVIIEVKQNSYFNSEILNSLREMRVQQANMSKYCLAVCKLYPNIRKNNFKPQLHYIQKLIHDS